MYGPKIHRANQDYLVLLRVSVQTAYVCAYACAIYVWVRVWAHEISAMALVLHLLCERTQPKDAKRLYANVSNCAAPPPLPSPLPPARVAHRREYRVSIHPGGHRYAVRSCSGAHGRDSVGIVRLFSEHNKHASKSAMNGMSVADGLMRCVCACVCFCGCLCMCRNTHTFSKQNGYIYFG